MKEYALIYADPCWWYKDKLPKGHEGAAHHYTCMKDQAIIDLPVHAIAQPNSVCFMWVTFPKMDIALTAMKAWGFEFKTVPFVWVKRYERSRKLKKFLKLLSQMPEFRQVCQKAGISFSEFVTDLFLGRLFKGQGRYTFQNIEFCMVGTRGEKFERKDNTLFQVVVAPHTMKHRIRQKKERGRFKKNHSGKPTVFRHLIDRLYGRLPRIELFARSCGQGWDATGFEYDGQDIVEFLDRAQNPLFAEIDPCRPSTKTRKTESQPAAAPG